MDKAPIPFWSPKGHKLSVAVLLGGCSIAAAMQVAAPDASNQIPISLAAILGMGGVIAGVKIHKPDHPRVWYYLVAGIAFCMAGGAFFMSPHLSGLAISDVVGSCLLVVGFGLLAFAILAIGRFRQPIWIKTGLVDLLLVISATAVPVVQIAVFPFRSLFHSLSLAGAHARPLSAVLVLILNPVLMVLILVLLARLLLLPGRRPAALWLLVASFGVTLITDLAAVAVFERHGLHFGILPVGWILGLCLDGLAALDPSMLELTQRAPAGERILDRSTNWILAVVVLSGPIALGTAHLAGENVSLWTALFAEAATGLLLLLRLKWLFAERQDARELVEERERWFRSLVQNIADVIVVMDGHGRIQYLSPSAQEALGYSGDAATGAAALRFVHPQDRHSALHLFRRVLAPRRGVVAEEMRILDSRERWRWFRVAGGDLTAGALQRGVVLALHDVTERRTLVDELRYRAFYDILTGLPNRALLMDRLDAALSKQRAQDPPVTLLFLDLDNFKTVNDSLGHAAGDDLLIAIARRLQAVVRPRDTVARLGGDEFVVLLEHPEEPEEVAERILGSLSTPLNVAGRRLAVTASIGIALAASPSSEALLRDADVALYQAKAAGTSSWALFDEQMRNKADESLELANDLHSALDGGLLDLAYQPVYSAHDGSMVGLEALLRWQHDRRGAVAPERAVALAEELGLIAVLGKWILEQACHTVAQWRCLFGKPIWIAVNVSGRQLEDEGLVSTVTAALELSGLPADALVLELTEHVVARDPQLAKRQLTALASLGVRIAVDDFGTGYSSLAALGTMPLDILKIDRSFVAQIGEVDSAAEMIRAIVELGSVLGLKIIAEGVETEEELAVVRAQGCDMIQGYLLSAARDSFVEADFLYGVAREGDWVALKSDALPAPDVLPA